MITFARALRNPIVKNEIQEKKLFINYSASSSESCLLLLLCDILRLITENTAPAHKPIGPRSLYK